MKKNEVAVGGLYLARISGRLVTVRVDTIEDRERQRHSPLSGRRTVRAKTIYGCTNLATGREVTIKSAAKFRSRAVAPSAALATWTPETVAKIEELMGWQKGKQLKPGKYACLGCGHTVDIAEGDELPRDDERCSHEFELMAKKDGVQ